jgi:hypothetical protein
MPKLSSACFAMTVTSLMNAEILKLVYFAKYFTSKKESEWQLLKGKPLVANFTISLIFFH